MCRFDWLSINRKTYVPGFKTLPGTCTASENVTLVALSHSSARVIDREPNSVDASANKIASLRTALMNPPICFVCWDREARDHRTALSIAVSTSWISLFLNGLNAVSQPGVCGNPP